MTLPPADCLRRWSLLPARQIRTALLCTMAPSLAAMPAFILAGRITIVQQLVGSSGSISSNSKEHRIECFRPIDAGLNPEALLKNAHLDRFVFSIPQPRSVAVTTTNSRLGAILVFFRSNKNTHPLVNLTARFRSSAECDGRNLAVIAGPASRQFRNSVRPSMPA